MKTLKSKSGHEIEYFIDPAQMTFERYWSFNRYVLAEGGIGSDIESVSKHFSKLYSFIGAKMNEEAVTEAENLHFNFFSIINGINYVCNSVAAVVSKIDGKKRNDLSSEGIDSTAKSLKECNLTIEEIETIFEEVKKKLLGV